MQGKLKVLHIIDHMELGGAQNVVKGIIENDSKCEHLLYVLRKPVSDSKSTYTFYRDSHNKYDVYALFELKNVIQEHKIQILHCHLQKSFLVGYAAKKLFFKDIFLIFHEHGKIFRDGFVYSNLLNAAKTEVNTYIAISDATAKKLQETAKIYKEKIYTIINYVDCNHFNVDQIIKYDRAIQRKKLGIDSTDFVIGFAARTVERKGWKDLLLAVNRLKHTNIKAVIAGSGPDENKLQHLISQYNLEEHVRYIGFIEDILMLYSSIDSFIIPSHWEPLGITALEAQSCGVPVLASNVEGLNEIVRDMETGILFEAKDYEQIAEKILLLAEDDQLRNELIQNGLENAFNHSLDKYLVELNIVYQNHNDFALNKISR